ncbi:AAA family ATPase [Limnothrix sp. FACHB-708]|uniref:trifunctional serine/threonine-protein kinase/ATP-binding protein/sensor histidine kinase n=1 Tax=unclassified Limnothrix TaxID=2632864 RepID=UPI001683852D|nr:MULTISPECIES: ATP-binding sensor histidine kinase [unclassified Limnothrix]MBD2552820.1 AAA family ATPase [Limnothrix sp. FACHB-708]MBD2590090.1 AAA family ATPase [Limnothrix sp. FACHB-406]
MSPLTSSSSQPLPAIGGYTITEQLYWGSRTAVYRAVQDADQRSVVLKVLLSGYPTFGELVQFRNQYAIAKNLNLPGIIHPLTLQSLGNGYVLVMEEWGGVSLHQYLQQHQLNWVEVLKIALQLTTILHDLHQQRVIHKDIKPANILIDPESKEIKLIDFSIASLLPKETQEIQNPNILEGTLAYLAPEQTGRMNRGIDYRADYYALGVTLYQLLTGQLPFESDDPLELLHCHIAKTAQPVDQVNPSVPKIVGAIVAKLMAKNAEDRYQSALGLQHDLQQCLSQWETTGEVTEFELGQRDLSDRFLIPEKLYGRESEVQILLKSFERVSQGASELMLVAGFSGIGKTAVVNEVHKPITQQKGYFIKGKFDQFNRNIPLSAFVQALRDLMGQLLSESDAQLAQWKNRILEAVGDNGEVLIEVIPELEQVIGHQPAVPELSGTAAQNRFNLLFQKFIQVFTTANHPLVIFLDDLQWSDSASLQLLKVLMESSGYLLVLGAYRDNEVSPGHPLMLTIGELKKASLTVNTITLLPLSLEHTNCLVADTLKCSQELSKPLTQLVDRKTQGNPFFTTQFLKALHEDGYIVFDRDQGYWQCDIAQVNALTLTDDVVEFMALQLRKLPTATQEVLKLAACIGNRFELATLAIIFQQSPTATAAALWGALQEGFILPNTQMYSFFHSQEANETTEKIQANLIYRFLHDRVQQAAYSLISSDQKKLIHLTIGQLLQAKLSATERKAKLFDIVGHLNLGRELLTDQAELQALAQANLGAAQKAKNSTAYVAAKNFVQTGLLLLTSNSWHNQYDLSLQLHVLAAEVAYLVGDWKSMENYSQEVLDAAKTVLDKVEVYAIQINGRAAQNQMAEAISVGSNALAQLGVEFSSQGDQVIAEKALQDLALKLEGQVIEDLAKLPVMVNSYMLAALKLLGILFVPVKVSNPTLLPLLCAKMVSLSLQFGNSSVSAIGYIGYGLILTTLYNEAEKGYQFGKLALDLLDQFYSAENKAMVLLFFGAFIQHRRQSLQSTVPLLKEGYFLHLETGGLLYAGYSINNCLYNQFFSGLCLEYIQPETEKYADALFQMKQYNPLIYTKIKQQILHNLIVITDCPDMLIGDVNDEKSLFSQYIRDNELMALAWAYVCKLMLAYIFGHYDRALSYIDNASPYLDSIDGFILIPIFYFYAGLTYLRIAATESNSERLNTCALAEKQQIALSRWATSAPMNHQHKVNLLEAEKYRVLGSCYEAGDWYDLAIAGAKENNYLQEEALANELAAQFYLDWGKTKVAAGYMQEAYYCYARWGARAKINDLEKRYPQLLQPIVQAANQRLTVLETLSSITTSAHSIHSTPHTNSSSAINETLDLATLLQISQAFASTIALDELLRMLAQTMLENSGADRCALMLCEENQWQVRVIADLERVTLQSASLDNNLTVPVKLIQYVKNTETTVMVDDLKTDLPVIGDYLNQHQPKSVLCLPILNQGKLRAILHLENHSTSGVFTNDRIAVLNFLCTQAAISLENARLYQKSQLYAQQLEQSQLQMVQSEKMASLGNLVAGVAHEINNPIGFLNGSIDNAKEHVQDLLEHLALYQQHYPSPTSPIQDHAEDIDLEYVCEDLPQLLNSMQGATDRIKSISTSLRTFSRADTEYKVSANLHEGIDSTLLILKYRLKANANRPAIEVITNYGEIPPIDCFPGQLNQVFMNILANAIDMFDELAQGRSFKELEAHPQQITISTTLVDDQVQITIRDNGKGMNAEVQSRIFDHLFTTKSVGKGTGLGLAIAQQIVVDKHGGSLTVESEPGQGAEFLIRLPIEG